MKHGLLSLVMLLGGAVATVNAQDNVYLIKGNKVVAKYPVNAVDYMSFKLPEGVVEGNSVLPEAVETGKNYIKYKVKLADKAQYYGHAFFQSQLLDRMLRQYYNTTIDEVDEATLNQVLKLLLSNYGYMDQGEKTFTIKDGDNDGYGTTFYVPGGQDFYVATVNVTGIDPSTQEGIIGDEISLMKMTTKVAGESAETLSVEYAGLTDSGEAKYNIVPGSGIKTMYFLLAKKKQLDQNVSLYGYDYVMFSLASPLLASDWLKYADQESWELDGEDDYVMSVLGVDANGDWVKASAENHIVVNSDNCPKVNILSQSKGDGKVSVNFEINPSNVSAAHVRLMGDNDVMDALNGGASLDEIAVGGDAVDITSKINEAGEYTYSNDNNFPARWNALLISAADENGTTVTRVIFNPFIDSEWEVKTTTFPKGKSEIKERARRIGPACGDMRVGVRDLQMPVSSSVGRMDGKVIRINNH